MQITVATDRCVGAGQCVLSAPEVFDQDDDGLVALRTSRPGPEQGENVRLAAALCPSRSITVQEKGPTS